MHPGPGSGPPTARSCSTSAAVRNPHHPSFILLSHRLPLLASQTLLQGRHACSELHTSLRCCGAALRSRLRPVLLLEHIGVLIWPHVPLSSVAQLFRTGKFAAPCLQTPCRAAYCILKQCTCAGIGTLSTGHCHPKVVAAISEQAHKVVQGQQNMFFSSTAQVLLGASH